MPTVIYCDYTSGNDTTGDGSAGNPYKTIDKASTGLTGGDEVRCAKGPAHSALSGTLAWVNGSATVNTSEDLTGVLAAKDFVGKNSAGETWWEILSLTSSAITLVVAYRGSTATTSSYKAGMVDTGTAATSTSTVQTVSASGTSAGNIKITGGWNLAGTPAQDGFTFFWQSGANKWGYGLYSTTIDYITVDDTTTGRLGWFRYSRGLQLDDYITINKVTCNGNTNGIYLSTSLTGSINAPTCCGNSNVGINATTCTSLIIASPVCNGNVSQGIYLTTCIGSLITSPVCDGNSQGIFLISCSNIAIKSPTISNSSNAIYISNENGRIVCYDYAHDESTWSNVFKIANWSGFQCSVTSIQESESGGAARNRVYFYGGYTQDNTAEADGGSGKCLQFNPKSATAWIEQDFQVPVTASAARTVAIKMKDDESFNGSVYLELWYLGVCIVGPTEKTMTTSYASQEMTASSEQITVDGVLTLKVKVYGTAGAVYADTLSYT